jgi:GcrA cell cycle regulator
MTPPSSRSRTRPPAAAHSIEWSDERIAALRRLLADPRGLTARQIARELGGVSRRAVIGKARRLGLPLPRRGQRAAGRRRATARGPDAVMRIRAVAERRRMSAATPRIAFLELEPHHCRWPFGWRPPFRFCGRARVPRSPYCAFHTARGREPCEPGAPP